MARERERYVYLVVGKEPGKWWEIRAICSTARRAEWYRESLLDDARHCGQSAYRMWVDKVLMNHAWAAGFALLPYSEPHVLVDRAPREGD